MRPMFRGYVRAIEGIEYDYRTFTSCRKNTRRILRVEYKKKEIILFICFLRKLIISLSVLFLQHSSNLLIFQSTFWYTFFI